MWEQYISTTTTSGLSWTELEPGEWQTTRSSNSSQNMPPEFFEYETSSGTWTEPTWPSTAESLELAEAMRHVRQMATGLVEVDPTCKICMLAWDLGLWAEAGIDVESHNRTGLSFAGLYWSIRLPSTPTKPPQCMPGQHYWVCGCGESMDNHHSSLDNHMPITTGCAACHRSKDEIQQSQIFNLNVTP